MKVVGSFRDPLSRQLSEAVRIDLRGGGVLNSKTEYSRCRVPRLVVDMEEWKRKKTEEKRSWIQYHPRNMRTLVWRWKPLERRWQPLPMKAR